MRYILTIIVLFSYNFNSASQEENYEFILQKHVDSEGKIDYKALEKDKAQLISYLNYLAITEPDENWTENREKAFWLNVYNAYTLKIIVDNYPLKKNSCTSNKQDNSIVFTITNTKNSSIMHIEENGKKAWDIDFVTVGGKNYTLNHVEHNIIRKKFNDGRIHVGLNAASLSGPRLVNYVFTEENIETSLDRLMVNFVNDNSKNKITSNKIKISKVFEWYPKDFNNGDIISFINKFSKTKIDANAEISYEFYDWTLNQSSKKEYTLAKNK